MDFSSDAIVLVMKLDYERQCYRHARTIVRERLRQLQASVDETVRAVNRTCPAARKPIPLPRRALLTPPPEVDCEFKGSSREDAGGAPRPGPARARGAAAQDDAAVRMKLDYERQCYRHEEMILRDGLRLLQVSMGETIKAINRSERTAAKPQSAAKRQAAAKRQLAAKRQAAAKRQLAAKRQAAAKRQQPDDRKLSVAEEQEAPCAAVVRGRCIGRDPDPRVRFMLQHDSKLVDD
jgi:hypothetical protein